MAEKEGFEPSRPFRGLHDFQSCALDQLGDFSIAAPGNLYDSKRPPNATALLLYQSFWDCQAPNRHFPKKRRTRLNVSLHRLYSSRNLGVWRASSANPASSFQIFLCKGLPPLVSLWPPYLICGYIAVLLRIPGYWLFWLAFHHFQNDDSPQMRPESASSPL